ncbi:MAG: acyl-CoA desaturase [Myxococcota bacterium]
MASAAGPELEAPTPLSEAEGWWTRQDWPAVIVYWGLHAAALLALYVASGPLEWTLLGVTFYARLFGITGGYHRYFAHKSYRTSRAFQFVLALVACSATQKGPLWWAGHHRDHHKNADGPGDLHSPRDGLYHAHQGWIFEGQWDGTPLDRIEEFARYPELVWLNRNHHVPPFALAILCFAIGGFSGLIWGYVLSTVLLWHATYTINSLAHVWGSRRYETRDDSRNNFWLALLTLGEGWHNNHHHFCASARQGFRWWEIDVTYYVLRGLAAVGLVWDIREPPERIVYPERSPAAG